MKIELKSELIAEQHMLLIRTLLMNLDRKGSKKSKIQRCEKLSSEASEFISNYHNSLEEVEYLEELVEDPTIYDETRDTLRGHSVPWAILEVLRFHDNYFKRNIDFHPEFKKSINKINTGEVFTYANIYTELSKLLRKVGIQYWPGKKSEKSKNILTEEQKKEAEAFWDNVQKTHKYFQHERGNLDYVEGWENKDNVTLDVAISAEFVGVCAIEDIDVIKARILSKHRLVPSTIKLSCVRKVDVSEHFFLAWRLNQPV